MVGRCFHALKRGNLELKPKYLCHALIKTFLLEQKSIIDPNFENQHFKIMSGKESDVSKIRPYSTAQNTR